MTRQNLIAFKWTVAKPDKRQVVSYSRRASLLTDFFPLSAFDSFGPVHNVNDSCGIGCRALPSVTCTLSVG